MSQQPYSPWPVAEKPVSQDRMKAILAKRTNNVEGPSPKSAEERPASSGLPSSAAPGPVIMLVWQKPYWSEEGVTGYVLSTCGRYRIDRCGKSYTCWRKAAFPGLLNLKLGVVDKKEAAIALCQADAEQARTGAEYGS